jgi:small subunit ribosomal protein S15
MALEQARKQEIIAQNRLSEQDTGSTDVQVAVLTVRINEITEHLKQNPKDFATRRGLLILVGKRRRLLNYYKRKFTATQYQALLDKHGLRK